MSEKIKKVEDSAESIKEEIKKTAESEKKADSAMFDLSQKVDNIGADLKSVIDKIDSFEVDTDEVLENVSHETSAESNKDKKGAIALIAVILIIIAFVFKDKIANAVQKRQNP